MSALENAHKAQVRDRPAGRASPRLDSSAARAPIPRMPPTVRIGTQGWNYDAWVGSFYPSGTRPGDFLTLYARAFDTVEVDSTFYAIPAAKTVRGWAERVPAHFT